MIIVDDSFKIYNIIDKNGVANELKSYPNELENILLNLYMYKLIVDSVNSLVDKKHLVIVEDDFINVEVINDSIDYFEKLYIEILGQDRLEVLRRNFAKKYEDVDKYVSV